jgi:hypothetical protein
VNFKFLVDKKVWTVYVGYDGRHLGFLKIEPRPEVHRRASIKAQAIIHEEVLDMRFLAPNYAEAIRNAAILSVVELAKGT